MFTVNVQLFIFSWSKLIRAIEKTPESIFEIILHYCNQVTVVVQRFYLIIWPTKMHSIKTLHPLRTATSMNKTKHWICRWYLVSAIAELVCYRLFDASDSSSILLIDFFFSTNLFWATFFSTRFFICVNHKKMKKNISCFYYQQCLT